jgi:hypothetical protein
MIADAQICTVVDPALWRRKLGVPSTDVLARVDTLEASQAKDVAVSLDVIEAPPGTFGFGFRVHQLCDWLPVLVLCPDDGKYYRVQTKLDSAGFPNFYLVAADVIEASDGRMWRLSVYLDPAGNPQLGTPTLL